MMIPDKKLKNNFTALGIVAFMIFYFLPCIMWEFLTDNYDPKKNAYSYNFSWNLFIMLGLSFAAVPLYDIFCRVTGFGGTTQISKEAPNIVLDQKVSVRFDTNVNNLPWNFKVKKMLWT